MLLQRYLVYSSFLVSMLGLFLFPARAADTPPQGRLMYNEVGPVASRCRIRLFTWPGKQARSVAPIAAGGATLRGYVGPATASPKGNNVAFVCSRSPDVRGTDLWIMDMETGNSRRVTGDEGGYYDARWSPDSAYLIATTPQGQFADEDALTQVPRSALVSVELKTGKRFCLAKPAEYPAWSKSGTHVYYREPGNDWMLRVSRSGGKASRVLRFTGKVATPPNRRDDRAVTEEATTRRLIFGKAAARVLSDVLGPVPGILESWSNGHGQLAVVETARPNVRDTAYHGTLAIYSLDTGERRYLSCAGADLSIIAWPKSSDWMLVTDIAQGKTAGRERRVFGVRTTDGKRIPIVEVPATATGLTWIDG